MLKFRHMDNLTDFNRMACMLFIRRVKEDLAESDPEGSYFLQDQRQHTSSCSKTHMAAVYLLYTDYIRVG